jgi:uncharacterized membrane protein YfcA
MMKSAVKLFLVLATLTVAVLGWITGQWKDRNYMILVLVLISATLASFLIMNISEHREQARKRKEKESESRQGPGAEAGRIKRSGVSFALKDKKSGLTWGGGNIKASEATRGTKRKFLGQ